MTGHTPLQLAARQAVGGYLEKIRKYEPNAREGHDGDAVHDMRVATRRLRSTLDLLESAPTSTRSDCARFDAICVSYRIL